MQRLPLCQRLAAAFFLRVRLRRNQHHVTLTRHRQFAHAQGQRQRLRPGHILQPQRQVAAHAGRGDQVHLPIIRQRLQDDQTGAS